MSGDTKGTQEAMNVYCVTLAGPAPWGFRLQGGKDFNMPLTVSRLTPEGKATQAGVGVGDWLVAIGESNVEEMTHVEAQNKIRAATDSLTLTLSRAFQPDGGEQKQLEVIDNRGEGFYEELYPEKHSLRVENIPCFIPNDRSKKRLIEDTQDWQPRTGTTQSRSFRILAQLTGTDFMQDPDDENMKRSSHGVTPCPSKTKPATKPEGTRAPAPPKPPASSGPACRPPWVMDPNFAERYHPEKTSTVVTQHSQPAQPTPMQNRSSILQAAQQNPAENTGRTPLCAACNKIIRGRYVVALGRSWHPEEFTCCQCRALLDEGGFFEEKGSVYCTKCYDNRYAPNCGKCKKKITGEIMHALKMTYHVQCFLCAACKTPIRNQAFYMEEGEPYCERDYEKMFGTKCHGCDFKIDAGDRFLEALGYSWHDTCFVCALCHINLEGKTFYSKKDKPLCKSHAFSPL
ncbi:PDZ and LIM domain protein 7 isoform X1 [Pygocentrus nattereri]|uniref:PDZ and LIM domain protein 7 isoform X1 n=2 Tax=Pygocentrus nattereri TaxID=42514 RepID=UPI001890BE95|nr:PDZ and LIM domain protein 7 isoform X1 [Pygocentrus nattereri]